MPIKTKSVHTAIDPREDGRRLLVTRFRGRGLASSKYDVWMPNLGPSEKLLKRFLQQQISWSEFQRGYRLELFQSADLDQKNQTILNHGQKFTLRLLQELARREPVTLLCHCAQEEAHCHRHLLQKILQGKI